MARTGTKAYLEQLKQAEVQNRPELIGQFGVGFYASFMAANRVTVISRPGGTKEGVKWESDGQGEFSVEPIEKESRGTDVILHLRDDAKEFLTPYRIRDIVKRYSDFIDHPVVMDGEKGEETLNSRQAIWLRNKSEIKSEEYNGFYKQLAHDFEDPLKVIHVAAEGQLEFRALMFLPAHRPMDFMMGPEKKSGLDLYVRRVLIQHEAEELAPPYLRFVRGVVDSADLPLNVSRETLQHNPVLAKIKSNVVNRVLKALEEMRDTEYDKYVKFFGEFEPYLKEGAGNDFANRDRLADLLLFESTKTKPGEFTTLAKYLQAMPGEQKEIYYLIGESRSMLENSPYLESFKARGQEVLLLTDSIDEFLVHAMSNYKDKPLKAVDRGAAPTDEAAEAKLKEQTEKFTPVLEAVKKALEADVKEVRLSSRLKESAAVLVADEYGMSAHMERLLHRIGRGEEVRDNKRVLELNPDHPVVQGLLAIQQKDASDPRVENTAKLLFDQAVVAEGSRVKDPVAFAKRVNELLAREVAAKSE
jgi:molecular chaperone HtpG